MITWQRLPLAVPVAEADVREANRGSIPSSTVPAVSRCARLMSLARTCMARHFVAARRPRSATRVGRGYERAAAFRARRTERSIGRSAPRAHTGTIDGCSEFCLLQEPNFVPSFKGTSATQRRGGVWRRRAHDRDRPSACDRGQGNRVVLYRNIDALLSKKRRKREN